MNIIENNILGMKAAQIFLALFLVSASALRAQQTVEIDFGLLYGYSHSTLETEVISGTCSVGTALTGNTFYWVCLDAGSSSPDFDTSTYTLASDASALSGGFWGSTISDPTTMNSIGRAISNMFYFYRTALAADNAGNGANNTAGTGFQIATWYLTEGYADGVWSGVVDQTAVNALIAWDSSTAPMIEASANSWVADMLQASLVDAPAQQIFFANPNQAGFQPIALLTFDAIVVPEPGGVMLLGIAGLLAIFRHRRRS